MKVAKLPRKFKKSLKSKMLSKMDAAWESGELKIYAYSANKRKVTSYTLGI